MRHPPAGQVWIHVDRLDREDGKVWAIQSHTKRGKPIYRIAANVICRADSFTQFFGPGAEQPKAVIVVPGPVSVRFLGVVAVIEPPKLTDAAIRRSVKAF